MKWYKKLKNIQNNIDKVLETMYSIKLSAKLLDRLLTKFSEYEMSF